MAIWYHSISPYLICKVGESPLQLLWVEMCLVSVAIACPKCPVTVMPAPASLTTAQATAQLQHNLTYEQAGWAEEGELAQLITKCVLALSFLSKKSNYRQILPPRVCITAYVTPFALQEFRLHIWVISFFWTLFLLMSGIMTEKNWVSIIFEVISRDWSKGENYL